MPPRKLQADEALRIALQGSQFGASPEFRRELGDAVDVAIQAYVSKGRVPATTDVLERFLATADEVTLTRMLIGPLFRQMGFQGTRVDEHTDRRQEFGRDACNIRFKLPSGHFIYCALQVKKGDISAASGKPTRDIMGLLNQAEKALEKTTFDYDTGLSHRADHVFIVSAGSISKDARQLLEEHIEADKRRRILFLDGADIVRLVDEYGIPLRCHYDIRAYLRRPRAKPRKRADRRGN
jgi:hypothetical protein